MARSPDRDDKRLIVKLAEQGHSVRRISRLVKYSRPTVSKYLAEAGFDPKTGKLPAPPGAATEAPEGSFDFEEEMRRLDEELRSEWMSLTDEERDRIIAQGPAEDSNTRGGFLDASYGSP